jgi:DNA modification methylase
MLSANTIYNDDCFEILPKLQQDYLGKVDMILTDPPYNISNSKTNITFDKNRRIKYDFGEWDKFNTNGDFLKWSYSWIDLCIPLLKDNGMMIMYFDKDNISYISHYLKANKFVCKGYFADCKSNPVPQLRKVKFMNSWEIVGIWKKEIVKNQKEYTFNNKLPQQKDYVIRPTLLGKERTEHPTQKPLSVLEIFIKYFTNINDIILDPFCGSGSTCVCSKMLNRKFIGIEKDEKYYNIAKKRIDDVKQIELVV